MQANSKRVKTAAQNAQLHAAAKNAIDDPEVLQAWGITPELKEVTADGDVLLVCCDNRTVRCHSLILRMASPMLRNMLDATCAGCGTANPTRMSVPDDAAEHWLLALMHLCPLPSPPPTPTAQTGIALGLLGHKYGSARLLQAWQRFAATIESATSAMHHKWHLNDWSSQRYKAFIDSPPFQAFGATWQLQWHPSLDDDMHGVCLRPAEASGTSAAAHPKPSLVEFVLVNQHRPVSGHNRVVRLEEPRRLTRGDSQPNCWLEEDLVDEEDLHAYIKDNSLEVHAILHPPLLTTPPSSKEHSGTASGRLQLSHEQGCPGNVSALWQLAHALQDELLLGKCRDFLAANAYRVLQDSQFRKDIFAALKQMEPADVLCLTRCI